MRCAGARRCGRCSRPPTRASTGAPARSCSRPTGWPPGSSRHGARSRPRPARQEPQAPGLYSAVRAHRRPRSRPTMSGLLRRIKRSRAADAGEAPAEGQAAAPEGAPTTADDAAAPTGRAPAGAGRRPPGSPASRPPARADRDLPAGVDPAEAAVQPPHGPPRPAAAPAALPAPRARADAARPRRPRCTRSTAPAAATWPRTRRVVGAKVQRLAGLDAEARALETALGAPRGEAVVFQPGVGGTCAACGELYGSAARFCSNCGTPTGAAAPRDGAPSRPSPPGAAEGAGDADAAAGTDRRSRRPPTRRHVASRRPTPREPAASEAPTPSASRPRPTQPRTPRLATADRAPDNGRAQDHAPDATRCRAGVALVSVEAPQPEPADPQPAGRRCPRCGAAMTDEQEWCLHCGAAVGTRVVAAPGWRTPIVDRRARCSRSRRSRSAIAIVQLADDTSQVGRDPPAAADADARRRPPARPRRTVTPDADACPTASGAATTPEPTATPRRRTGSGAPTRDMARRQVAAGPSCWPPTRPSPTRASKADGLRRRRHRRRRRPATRTTSPR